MLFLNHLRSALFTSVLSAAAVLLAGPVRATTYYVSPSGNDANPGTTQAQPWATITRVNQLSFSFQPGDQILFQRGGTYRGTLVIASNGTASQPITVGSYGTGSKPVISGAVPVTSWTPYQGNIWVATVPQDVKYLFVNNELMTLARYPNTGWLRNDNGDPTTLHDAALTQANGYWNGATAVIRTSNWSYHTTTVTSFSNGTLTHTSTGYNIQAWSWGYFLCNKLSELDAAGEWYYDGASDQLYLWAPDNADPNSLPVEAAVVPTGIAPGWTRHHLTVSTISFRHFTDAAINLDMNDHVVVDNCRFERCYQGIRAGGDFNTYTNNTFEGTFGNAMFLMDNDGLVQDNTFTDIALEPGLGESGWGYFGIRTTGSGMVIRANHLQNIGYIGIASVQDALIEKNVVDQPMAILNDGSGIAFDNADGMVIRENIVRNVIGDLTSSAPGSPFYEHMGHGIYFGNTSIQNTTVELNTVTNCEGHGIHMDHTLLSQGNQVKDNVLFGNKTQICLSDISNISTPGAVPPYYMPAYNDVITGNTLYCTAPDQVCLKIYNCYNAVPVDFGTLNNNRYLHPYNELSIYYFNLYSAEQRYFSLEEWQADRNEDPNSTRSAHHFSDVATTAEIGGVLTPNGAFDYDVNGWVAFPGNVALTHDQSFLDNGAMKAHLPNNSLYNEMVLNGPDQFPIVNGAWYRVRVSTQSTVLGQVNVRIKGLTQMTGPYAAYERKVPFSSERRDLEFYFQNTLGDQAVIQLVSHYTDPTYWIDNIEVQQVQVASIDPSEQQIIVVNDGPTAATFALDGCWSDVDGAYHSSSVTVAGHRSMILVKEADADCGLTTGVGTEAGQSVAGTLLFPNPVEAGGSLHFRDTTLPVTSLRLYDAGGRCSGQATHDGSGSWMIPTDLGPGLYVAEAAGPSGTMATQRIILRP